MASKNNNLAMETKMAVIEEQISNIKEVAEETKKQNTAEHQGLKDSLTSIECKLDKNLATITTKMDDKADKEDVEVLDNRFWGLIVGMLFLLAGIIAAWFKK